MSEFWKTLKVGDIVYTYYKGLFKIVDISPIRKERYYGKKHVSAPIVIAKKIATANMLPCKPENKTCDISWCRPVLQTTLDYAKANGVNFE